MKKRILAGILVLVMALALLTGCGKSTAPAPAQSGTADSGESAAPAPQATGRAATNEIAVGIAQDLDESLDPHNTVAAGTREVLFNVYEGLVKPNSDGDLVPAIASDVNIAEDGLTYTFTLRQGVKFHNGAPVTMQDVFYSVNRCKDDSSGSALVPELGVVSDIQYDDSTLTLTLSEPNPEFLSCMTLAIIPDGSGSEVNGPAGTGPFRLVSRAAQDTIVLERFEDYWGTPAFVDKVTYKVIENVEGLILGLQSGALDLVAHMTSTQTAQLSKNDFHVEVGSMNLVQALYLNNAEAPFDDVRVRQALSYAIDKQGVIDMAFDGYGFPIGSAMFPAFGQYFDPELTYYYSHNVEKAKELLAEAGYPNGFDMTITVPSNYQPHMDTAQVIVNQLKEVGVNATILPIEWASWLSDVYSGRQYQSTVVGVDASKLTASALLARYESSAHGNFMNFNSATYDELYAKAQACYDDAEQTLIYRDAERDLTENAASVYIQDMADLVAVRNGLEGLTFYPLYVLDVSTLHWVG